MTVPKTAVLPLHHPPAGPANRRADHPGAPRGGGRYRNPRAFATPPDRHVRIQRGCKRFSDPSVLQLFDSTPFVAGDPGRGPRKRRSVLNAARIGLQPHQACSISRASRRSVAQSGRAPSSGGGGRRFESCYSDQFSRPLFALVRRRWFSRRRDAAERLGPMPYAPNRSGGETCFNLIHRDLIHASSRFGLGRSGPRLRDRLASFAVRTRR